MTILCEPSAEDAASLAGLIEGGVLPVGNVGQITHALAADPAETVVVLGAGVGTEEALQFTSWLRHRHPAVGVLLIREDLQVDEVMAAMRAGVREVLPAGDETAVNEACHRHRQVISLVAPAAGGSAPGGRVIAVLSAKGGCGKTTFATNLSVILGRAGQRVCLLDLDLAFGDVAITLGLKPDRTLVDVLALGDQLDAVKVTSLVTPYKPNVDTILAPIVPGDAERIPVGKTASVIDVLTGLYDYIVVDTPAQITDHVLAALDACHQHILLTAPEVPALKNLRVALDMLDLLSYDRRGRSVILNRSDAQVGLSEAEIVEVVRAPIAGRIPSSRDVPISINRGEPIASAQPQHAVSSALTAFVSAHVHQPAATPVEARRGGRGGRFFGRRSS